MKIECDVKEKHFYGVMLIGGGASLAEGALQHGFAFHFLFPGMVLAIAAVFVGGLAGFVIKDALRVFRGLKPYRGVHMDGMMMGAFFGCFVGTLWQIVTSADGGNLLVGSIVGSFVGSFMGALPDEFVTPVLGIMGETPEHKRPRPVKL